MRRNRRGKSLVGKVVETAVRHLPSAMTWLSRVSGSGKYTVANNSLVGAIPTFSREVKTRIRYREYVRDVYSRTSTTLENFVTLYVDANDPATFPWASQIANNYQKWKLHGMIIEFKSMANEYVNSLGSGSVVIATQYDVKQPLFETKREMENSEFANSCKPSESMLHPVECDAKTQPFRVLFTYDGETNDRMANYCKTTVCAFGCPSNDVLIGELWVSYDIEFQEPYPRSARASTFYGPNYTNAFFDSSMSLLNGGTGSSHVSFDTGLVNGVTCSYIEFRSPGMYEIHIGTQYTIACGAPTIQSQNCTLNKYITAMDYAERNGTIAPTSMHAQFYVQILDTVGANKPRVGFEYIGSTGAQTNGTAITVIYYPFETVQRIPWTVDTKESKRRNSEARTWDPREDVDDMEVGVRVEQPTPSQPPGLLSMIMGTK